MEIYQFYFLLYFYCTRSYGTVCRISRFSTTIQTFPQWCCESKNRITILSAMEYHNSETKDDQNIFTSGERRNNVAINYVWPTWITRRSRKAGFIKEKEIIKSCKQFTFYSYVAFFLYHLFPNKKAAAETILAILSVPIRRFYHVLSCLNRIQVLFMRLSQWNIHRTICDLFQSTWVIELYFRTTKENAKDSFDILFTLFLPSRLYFTLFYYSFTILSDTTKLIFIMYKIWHVKL